MKAARSVIAGVCVLVGLFVSWHGQAEERDIEKIREERLRAMLAPDTLPGKELPLIPGYEFRLADYPPLRGYHVDMSNVWASPELAGKIISLTGGNSSARGTIDLEVAVAQTSSAAIHRYFFERKLALFNSTGSVTPYRIAGVGLFAFSNRQDARHHDPKTGSHLEFVRNNVFVRITSGDENVRAWDLAKLVDAKLMRSHTVRTMAESGAAPDIRTFGISSPVLKVGESADVTIDVADPLGEGTTSELRDSPQGVVSLGSDKKRRFHAQRSGSGLLRLVVTSYRLVVSTRTLEITVLE